MKTILLLILLTIAAGMATGYRAYQSSLSTDENIRNETLSAISQIKEIDSLIDTQVLQSRYGLVTDYDELAKLTRKIRTQLLILDLKLLSKYATVNEDLASSVDKLTEQLVLKIDLIENFKSHNSVLRNSIKYAPILGDEIIASLANNGNPQTISQLKLINNSLYRWALYGDSKEADFIKGNASFVSSLSSQQFNNIDLLEYSVHLAAVIDEQEKTQRYIENLLSITTRSTVNQLESAYLNHYLDLLYQSEKDRLYILLYALFVALFAVYLGIMLRKSYQKLKVRDEYRSQQINVVYKHLGYADSNVAIIKDTFGGIKDTLAHLGGIHYEVKKKNYDSKKINTLLSRAIKRYRRLDNEDSISQTDQLLDKSDQNLNKASALVKQLMTI